MCYQERTESICQIVKKIKGMKGIILAGGSGTRLHPLTLSVSKQLMPVFDKPMIYYPLSTLISAGIREILIVCLPIDIPLFKKLLGDGASLGCSFSYAEQAEPKGIAEALIIGEKFIGNDTVCLILGDNIFYGSKLTSCLRSTANPEGGVIFAHKVAAPQRYGVVSFDNYGNATSIQEKPDNPTSNYAVCGIYLYENKVIDFAKEIKPSQRGELEITDVNVLFLKQERLQVVELGAGEVWLDTGTFTSLSEASHFVETIQRRKGIVIGSPELSAYKQGFIDESQLKKLANQYAKSGYGERLLKGIK